MGSEISAQRRTPGQQHQIQQNKSGTAGRSTLQSQTSQESQAEHDYAPSQITKPIGSSAPGHSNLSLSTTKSSRPASNLPKEIVIVSRGETEEDTKRFTFPPPFKPLIPIGHETLHPSIPQIDPTLLIDITCLAQRELNRKAIFVASQQNTLCLIIKDIEAFSVFLNINVLSEKNKRFLKIVDNFSKLNDIEILISKVDQDLDLCVSRLNLLNRSLPETLRLPDQPLEATNQSQ
jgi:hypothetical protein